jgi:hypothetical protein
VTNEWSGLIWFSGLAGITLLTGSTERLTTLCKENTHGG